MTGKDQAASGKPAGPDALPEQPGSVSAGAAGLPATPPAKSKDTAVEAPAAAPANKPTAAKPAPRPAAAKGSGAKAVGAKAVDAKADATNDTNVKTGDSKTGDLPKASESKAGDAKVAARGGETKVDGEPVDPGGPPAKPPTRAPKAGANGKPPRKPTPWPLVVARGAATAAAGALALVLGVTVMPHFIDTSVSSRPAPSQSQGTTPAPSLSGALPGAPVPGGPLPGAPNPSGSRSATATPTGPPQLQPGRPADALAGWAAGLSHLGIPQVALQAYGYAETVLVQTQPRCHLSWTLLAGIGSVESNHGQHGGAKLMANGSSQPRIIGIQLDGTSTERIADTDDGKLDGDRQFDRAVGAMQFIPSTWQKWAIDADADGKADPYDLDDAALSSAYYLCAGGRDLATGNGWWAAVLSYNNITKYATRVYSEADRYGRNSTR